MKQLIMVQGEVDKDCEQALKSFMQHFVAPNFFLSTLNDYSWITKERAVVIVLL